MGAYEEVKIEVEEEEVLVLGEDGVFEVERVVEIKKRKVNHLGAL